MWLQLLLQTHEVEPFWSPHLFGLDDYPSLMGFTFELLNMRFANLLSFLRSSSFFLLQVEADLGYPGGKAKVIHKESDIIMAFAINKVWESTAI